MSMTTCECRSPQEQRLYDRIEGKEDKFRKTHARVFKLLERFDGQKPRIDIERALYFTQSMKETEGQPLVLRWAKALMHIAENISVCVQEDQLLLGRAGCDGRYGILYPELDGDFLDIAVRDLPTRRTSPAVITPEDAKRVIEEIAPYWKGKTYHEDLNAALPPEVHKLTYDDPEGLISRFIVNETSSFRSSIQWVHDYAKVLKRGFNGIKKEAQEKLAALDPMSAKDDREKRPFLEAVIIVCDAIVLWAKRHAVLARELAEKEQDPIRKAELLRMADNAERVPGEPARDFWEACQSQWFTQMFSRIEQKTGTTISNGRMDQYLYPYYKQDRAAGTINDKQAMELLECMWVGMAEFIDMYISPTGGAFNEGYAHWEAVTVGGQTPDGRDASNELTYLILKSKREFPLHYPDLAARIHSRAPERYLWDVAETIKDGSGFPKLINDEEVVPLYVSKGATFEEALDYAVSGCTEARMPNRDTYTSGGAYINFAAAVEMALRNGRMKKYGDRVRMVRFGTSVELCGGTHVSATGNIGFFKILNESAISAGVRRIEATPGAKAEEVIYAAEDTMRNVADYLNNPQILQSIKKIMESNEALKHEMEAIRREQVAEWAAKIVDSTPERGGMRLMATQTDRRPDFIKDLAFAVRSRSKNIVLVIGSINDGKPTLTVALGDDIVAQGVNAGVVVREAAKAINGGGGGQPFLATAGGKNPDGIQAAIDKAVELIVEQVK